MHKIKIYRIHCVECNAYDTMHQAHWRGYDARNTMHVVQCTEYNAYTIIYCTDTMHKMQYIEYNAWSRLHRIGCKEYNA